MVLLLFCPSKGTPNHPPLAISSLASYLNENKIDTSVLDINKSINIENTELSNKINYYFSNPDRFYEKLNNLEIINNIDTIYNFPLLLSILEKDRQLHYHMDDEEKKFVEDLEKEIDSRINQIIKSKASYVGFSTYISNIAYSCILSKRLKEKKPDIITFFGGSSTAYFPIRDFLLTMKITDFVAVGEGENSLLYLIQNLKTNNNKLPFNTIFSQNIAPLQLKKNEIAVPIVNDLDTLPFPDFSSFELSQYSPINKEYLILPIVASRGCINQCAYCSETQYWRKFRQRSVSNVIQEIKNGIKKYNAKAFFFHDSLINGNLKWLNEFCDNIINEKIDIHWYSYASVQNLDFKLLEKMKQSGCIRLTLGIEHISGKVLKEMKKNTTFEKAKQVLEDCITLNIMPVANIIYGLPGETDEDFANLLYFMALPQFRGNVYFSIRPFEIRVGSSVTNKIIEDMNEIYIKEMDYSMFTDEIQKIYKKINIYWLPDKKYLDEISYKSNVFNIFLKSQEQELNTQRVVVLRYDLPIVLKSIIKLESIPFIKQNFEEINEKLSYIEEILLMGAEQEMNLSEISEQMYSELNSDETNQIENDKIEKILIDCAILLTQKGIIYWN